LSEILITDDDSSTSELIGLVVGQFLNCEYDITENILQAIKTIILNDYKLIIINIHLQGVDKFKVVDILKNLSPNTEIVAITNSDDPEFRNSILKSGAAHVLNKPFSIKQMLEVVKEYTRATKKPI